MEMKEKAIKNYKKKKVKKKAVKKSEREAKARID